MHRLKYISVAAAAALVFAGSAFAYRVVRVGANANGTLVVLRPSDRLVVTLNGNATAGFQWKVQRLDSSVVRFVSRTYVANSTPPKVGAPGKYVLRFRAKGLGVTTLRLGYVQSGSSKAAKTFRLRIAVKAPPPRV